MKNIQAKSQPSHRQELLRKMVKKPGLRGKVDAKCIECIYDSHDHGTWRFQVAECTSKACPIYSVRPTPTTEQK